MERILVSACLLGDKVRYDGGDSAVHGLLDRWVDEGRVVPFCPECAGGLPTPRAPAEISGGDAGALFRGEGKVINREGDDVTAPFVAGAEQALAACGQHRIGIAILKEKSPSCGTHQVYDGSFSHRCIPGRGITAWLLAHHGVALFNERELDQVASLLRDRMQL